MVACMYGRSYDKIQMFPTREMALGFAYVLALKDVCLLFEDGLSEVWVSDEIDEIIKSFGN